MLPVRTKLVVHFYVSSTAVWLLTAVTPSLFSDILGYYVVGLAVVYRLVALLLLARDFWAMRPPASTTPVLTLPAAMETPLRLPRREALDH
jgi:hypothetical protein